jgi:hypothetical protein
MTEYYGPPYPFVADVGAIDRDLQRRAAEQAAARRIISRHAVDQADAQLLAEALGLT